MNMKGNQEKKEVIVPVIVPLDADLGLDKEGVSRIFSYLYASGATPFILGTTGEAASLSYELKRQYIKEAALNRPSGEKLYVGILSNTLEESILLANWAFENGVQQVAATLPNYYKLTEQQMEGYFTDLAEKIYPELILYNIPATTGMSIPIDLIDKLSIHPKIVAVKDSERDLERVDRSLELWRSREDFKHYMGWSGGSAHSLIQGSAGIIPSTGNFAPSLYKEMCEAVEQGDEGTAHSLQKVSDELGRVYQSDKLLGESLWALKVIMREMGLCQANMMPPLYPLSEEEAEKVLASFKEVVRKSNLKLNLISHA